MNRTNRIILITILLAIIISCPASSQEVKWETIGVEKWVSVTCSDKSDFLSVHIIPFAAWTGTGAPLGLTETISSTVVKCDNGDEIKGTYKITQEVRPEPRDGWPNTEYLGNEILSWEILKNGSTFVLFPATLKGPNGFLNFSAHSVSSRSKLATTWGKIKGGR